MSEDPYDMTTDSGPSEPTTPAEPDDASARRTVPATAFVVAVMVAALLGILAVALLATGSGGDDDGERDDARVAAGRFGERFLTFRHDALDEWKADVLALSTGGFAGEVEEVEAGLRRLIGEAELDATTQVTEIFLGDVDNGTASAVLVYDRDVTSAEGTRTEADRYMQLELNLVDGEWLVDNVIDIASAGGGSVGSSPAAPGDPTGTTGTESTTATSAPGG